MDAKRPTLPIAHPRGERADAARNRQRILEAAEAIVSASGVDALSMNEVASAAGVGVGTVYRRFGDRAGLAYALLDRSERAFQGQLLSGPPPLGPGAEPEARLHAFFDAYVDRLDSERELLVMAESSDPLARYTSGAYALHHAHVAALMEQFAHEDADVHYLADALLAALDARLFAYHRDRGFSVNRLKAGLATLVTGCLVSTGSG